MFFKKENINELIYKQAKLSSDVSYSIRQIERGDKNKVEIETLFNNILDLKELTQKLERHKLEPSFLMCGNTVKVEDNKFVCRALYDETDKLTF